MLDVMELERTLDLWASMWLPEERAQFERALERVVDGDAPAAAQGGGGGGVPHHRARRASLGAPRALAWLLED